jgi:hypothetical protein
MMEAVGGQHEGGHGDAIFYVLGALTPAARARFEAHAAGCAECWREIQELQPTADGLALAVPQVEPPPALRQRLLTRASITRPDASPPDLGPTVAPPPPAAVQPVAPRPWWQMGQRAASVVAAASLLVAVASGAYAFTKEQELRTQSEQAAYATAQLSDMLSIVYQPNIVTRYLNGMDAAPKAKGKIIMVPDQTKAVVMAYDLPKLKQGETYQCWLTRQDEQRTDGGIFRSDESGKAYWVLSAPEALSRYRQLGVTRETGKGASSPSGPRVLGGMLQ